MEWNISKHGYLIPRICIETITIDGVNINYATGFNAKFIVDNSIGKDSKIRVVRSGDVIPFVIEIIEKSRSPLMPSIKYKWNETHVNILSENNESDTHKLKKYFTFLEL